MSDRDFENYLALLSRLLKLGPKQRDAIAGELRSHLEDRLEELLARGVPRDEAVRQALGEFGDAAGLAAEFVSLSGNKRKRWLMRLMTASVAATLLIAAGIFTFWPGGNAGPGTATLVGQTPAAATPTAQNPSGDRPTGELTERSIKEILDRRMAFEFAEKPLVSVASQLSEQTGITVYLDRRKLEEAGVNADTPITQTFRDMRLRTFLDLMLGELELTYMVKDDVLVITTPEDAESPDQMVVRVYDCRELLALTRPPGSARPRVAPAGGGGFFAIQDELPAKAPPASGANATAPAGGAPAASAPGAQSSGGFGSIGSGSGGEGNNLAEISDSENLIEVITTIIDPDSWNEVGGPGGIAEYKGLLSVATTQEIHEKVERLLNMFHRAANLQQQKVTVVE